MVIDNIKTTEIIDKNYCMSHYLAFWYVPYENINFFKGLTHKLYNIFKHV